MNDTCACICAKEVTKQDKSVTIYIYRYTYMVDSHKNCTMQGQLKNCLITIWVVGMKHGIWGRKTLKLGKLILIISSDMILKSFKP